MNFEDLNKLENIQDYANKLKQMIEENENNEDAATEARPAAASASASAAAARPGMRTPINFEAVDGGRRRTRKLKR